MLLLGKPAYFMHQPFQKFEDAGNKTSYEILVTDSMSHKGNTNSWGFPKSPSGRSSTILPSHHTMRKAYSLPSLRENSPWAVFSDMLLRLYAGEPLPSISTTRTRP